eukprot:10642791-Lingulodinium_polyedra.AAC.1
MRTGLSFVPAPFRVASTFFWAHSFKPEFFLNGHHFKSPEPAMLQVSKKKGNIPWVLLSRPAC